VKTIVSNIPTTEEGCAFTTTGVKDLDEVLHPRKFYMSNRRAITLCIISMYLIQCSAMDAPWGKPGCSLRERSLKTISKCYAPVSGVAGPHQDWLCRLFVHVWSVSTMLKAESFVPNKCRSSDIRLVWLSTTPYAPSLDMECRA
jgi:hypothetical protein